ncbi:unnamed protein product [Lasius platythorax]|uniref:Uncharacterized protein n=1 Tax=Lasius platythorax TaxID=488582 RepID=A0AAV2NCV0_9HYME
MTSAYVSPAVAEKEGGGLRFATGADETGAEGLPPLGTFFLLATAAGGGAPPATGVDPPASPAVAGDCKAASPSRNQNF